MKGIARNIVLAALICFFCQAGALGTKDAKSSLICYGIAIAAVVLCFWRCAVIARRNSERREYERHFQQYMRTRGTRR